MVRFYKNKCTKPSVATSNTKTYFLRHYEFLTDFKGKTVNSLRDWKAKFMKILKCSFIKRLCSHHEGKKGR